MVFQKAQGNKDERRQWSLCPLDTPEVAPVVLAWAMQSDPLQDSRAVPALGLPLAHTGPVRSGPGWFFPVGGILGHSASVPTDAPGHPALPWALWPLYPSPQQVLLGL